MAQKARRDRRSPAQTPAAEAEAVDGSEPFGPDHAVGSFMETAAIRDVTPAMMEEAAQGAAEAFEAVANPSAIQADHDDEKPIGEPGPYSAIDPDVSALIESQTGNRNSAMSSENVVEEMPVSSPSPLETTAEAALVEAAEASVDVELATVEEAIGPLVAPTVHTATAPTEAAESIGETVRWDLSSPGEAIGAYGAQVVEMVAANIAANSHFLTALMSATSMTDVMALNTTHLRRQVELLTTQRRQLTTLARTIAFDAMKPFSAVPTDHRRER